MENCDSYESAEASRSVYPLCFIITQILTVTFRGFRIMIRTKVYFVSGIEGFNKLLEFGDFCQLRLLVRNSLRLSCIYRF